MCPGDDGLIPDDATDECAAERDAEDFKTAKLSLSLRLNRSRVNLTDKLSRLYVFLQVFQTLRINPDGSITKACEFDGSAWVCGREEEKGGGGGRQQKRVEKRVDPRPPPKVIVQEPSHNTRQGLIDQEQRRRVR